MELSDVKERIRIGWLTLSVIPDPDKKFRGWKNGWAWQVVHDVREAFGYTPVSVRRFSPSTADVTRLEEVMGWMAWLRREEGELAMRRIMTWAYGVPIWRLGQREFRSERTIQRRIDRSIGAIMLEFELGVEELQVVDEKPEKAPLHFGERPLASDASEAEQGKVFISGSGYFFRGKPFDPEGKLGRLRRRKSR